MRLFISCVSAEFRAYREALRKGLVRHNVTVHIQEDFIAGGVPTLDKLNTYIADCDAVIHLVGDMTGAMANSESVASLRELCPDLTSRLPSLRSAIEAAPSQISYTQWEAYLAIYHRRRLLIASPRDTAPRDKTFINDAAQVEAQQVHLARLANFERYPEIQFSNVNQLVNGALNALVDLAVRTRPEVVTKPINLPYPSLGTLFKGRDEFMADLRNALQRAGGTHGAAIYNAVHGLGGIGKTRLAVEYAWRYQADYTALLFAVAEARAEGTSSAPDAAAAAKPAAELRRNLAALSAPLILNLPEQDVPDEEKQVVAVMRWLQANPGWLLIVDGANTEESASEVERYLPQLRGGHVLITSRRSNWSRHVERKELGVLPLEAAEAFLLESTASGRQIAPDDAAQAKALAQELGHLPLALEQATAYVDRHHFSLAGYLKEWRENQDEVASWFDPQTMTYPMSVAVTWQTSVAQLKPDARQLLDRLAFLSPEPVPILLLDVSVPGRVETDQRAAVAQLNAYSLVSWAAGLQEFTVHRLIQDVTRRSLKGDAYSSALIESLGWIEKAFSGDSDDARNWARLDSLAPHVRAVSEHGDARQIAIPTATLMITLGTLLDRKVSLSEVEPLYRRAADIIGKLAHEHPNSTRWQHENFRALWHVAHVEIRQGRHGVALPRLEQGREIMNRLARSDPGEASWQHDLSVAYDRIGDVLEAQGSLPEALSTYQESLAIAHGLAKSQPDNANWQGDLSLYYEKIGDVEIAQDNLSEAIKSYNASLVIRNRLAQADPDDPRWQRDLSVSYDRIGDALMKQSRWPEALESYRTSLAIREFLANADPGNAGWQHDLSISYDNVGDALEAQDDLAAALNSYRASLLMREHLAASDPTNAQWQVDLLWSHWRLAERADHPEERWPLIVKTLRRLKAEDKLTAEQASWLPTAEKQLANVEKR